MRYQLYRDEELVHSFDDNIEALEYAHALITDLDLSEEDVLYIVDIAVDESIAIHRSDLPFL